MRRPRFAVLGAPTAVAAGLAALALGACGSSPPPTPASPPAQDRMASHEHEHEHEHDHDHDAEHEHDHEHEHDGAHDHGPNAAHEHHEGMPHRFEHADEWAKQFDDPSRDAWQQPDRVIAALALAPTMTVADVGAGTGYFSVRLARAVPKGQVIATDIEPDMVRYLGERAAREHLPNIKAVLAGADDPNLAPGSVDRILVVDVWHHLGDRTRYAAGLAKALRPGGKLFVVDFTAAADRGPPKDMRLPPDAIIADLRAAGLTAALDPTQLPDQYIVVGTR